MAIVSFYPLPADLSGLLISQSLNQMLMIDGPLSASATKIEAVTTFMNWDNYGLYELYDRVDVEISGTFTYGDLATVTGTVSSITLSIKGNDIVKITEMDGDAGEVWVAMMGSVAPLVTILSGDDTITGTDQPDYLAGHDGNDRIFGGDGGDYILGGAGQDRLLGNDGSDSLFGGDQQDFLRGDAGRDYLNGEKGNDTLNGGQGRDSLYGGRGNDTLFGGSQVDRINGGAGNDTLRGGRGDDVFVFSDFGREQTTGDDIITDFELTDVIRLGFVKQAADLAVSQVGDDVVVTMADTTIGNTITVLDATAAAVEAAIETYSWYAY